MPVMVYHAPFPIRPDAATASALRPAKMLAAFEALGFDVRQITGYARDRKQAMRQLFREMKQGLEVEFVYSESATIPNSFTEKRHVPLYLHVERDFFKEMHEAGVPIGVFYRDIYWAFPEYIEDVGKPVATVMHQLYQWDLKVYNDFVDVLFLPTVQMAEHIPTELCCQTMALPPGSEFVSESLSEVDESIDDFSSNSSLNLLYIGAVGGAHYGLEQMLEVVNNRPELSLTICTRVDQWEKAKADYEPLMGDNTKVVHRNSSELSDLYAAADVCMLYIEPHPYRTFAAPVKLFEYLGNGKPVIVTEGTFAADFITSVGAGWALPYEKSALASLINSLMSQPGLLDAARANAVATGMENTWTDRAKQAAACLVQVGQEKAVGYGPR